MSEEKDPKDKVPADPGSQADEHKPGDVKPQGETSGGGNPEPPPTDPDPDPGETSGGGR